MKLIVIIAVSVVVADESDRVTLMSGPNSPTSGCTGDIVFTCQANRLSTVFWWINSNTTPIASYTELNENSPLPVNITTVDSLRFGLEIILTEVKHVQNSPPNYNYTTIACTNSHDIARRNISTIWCGRNLFNTSLTLTYPDGNG